MKYFVLILTILTIHPVFAQDEERLNFLGINPSVTVEPYYNSGELDINVFPLVYQRSITNRLDVRLSSILNYGIRKGNDRLSHIGIEAASPIFFKLKKYKSEVSKGFFLSPVLSLTRNNEAEHTNIGTWIEPGYNIFLKINSLCL
jgi:hypothetical protein